MRARRSPTIRWRSALAGLLLGTTALAAFAADRATVRLGDHGDYVRLVVDVGRQVKFNQTVGADGATGHVEIEGDFALVLPKTPAGALATLTAGAAGDKTTLDITFSKQVRVRAASVYPPEPGSSYRVVIDYGVVPGAPPVVAAAAPPPAPPPPPPPPSPPPVAAPAPKAPEAAVTPPAPPRIPAATPPAPPPPAASPPPPPPPPAVIAPPPPPAVAAPPPPNASPTKPLVAGEPFQLRGFRSAHFGDDADAVRAAIRSDFGVSGADVMEQASPSDGTTGLIVRLRELLPGSGPVEIVYVLGYKARRLIQVKLAWGRDPNPPLSEAQMNNVVGPLTRYLRAAGYDPETVATNIQLPSCAVAVFRGMYQRRRMALLRVEHHQETYDVQLDYIEKVTDPDVLRQPTP